jgi:lipid II:glycine glycyltransferase (peptidoglycan interpeptide bridge formation enzyme)
VPKGPLVDWDDAGTADLVLDQLERYARTQRAIFIKMDPDLPFDHRAVNRIAARGWRVSAEQIQFRNTVTLELARSEEEILAGMKPKWRYNIRLAQRKGVHVTRAGREALALFYDMYVETGARDGFLTRQFSYYQDVWETMLQAGRAELWIARVDMEPVAGLMLFWFGERAWYFYGASRGSHRDVMPNHLLQWEAIRWAREQGCAIYDFWGAPETLDESEPMYGVYRFKQGFGGSYIERIPAHDFVVNPALYWAYTVARPRYLRRLRGRHPGLTAEV